MKEYRHEELLDFTKEENVLKYQEALKEAETLLGREYPLIINGERIYTDEKITSYNPSDKNQIIGYVSMANKKIALKAIESSKKSFQDWRLTKPSIRAEILFRAASIMRSQKFELSALLTLEAGKPWKEADADTAEAIDFLEYYGRQMLQLSKGKEVISHKGESNTYTYIPMGISLVISPWNFACAIMAGTTVASLVTGNTVLLKPSSNTPVISFKFVEILEKAGLPKGVLNWIPGSSSEIGDFLVEHKDIALISFTGSKSVGKDIMLKASKVTEGQNHFKKVIAEMGGKDTIIVADDADIDLAANAIVYSAFGFSGQKCSACSRVIATKGIYKELLDLVKVKTKDLVKGAPYEKNVFIGPVIDQKSFDKIKDYIEIGKMEGSLEFGGGTNDKEGYFIDPTILANLKYDDRIMQEEIFGPVVGFCEARDFNEAIDYANATDYGLTGAVISNDPLKLEKARNEFLVGNLYLNRGCTGAIVGYQPFGGFNMSGTDSKAGGPDYLILHMQGRTISEKF